MVKAPLYLLFKNSVKFQVVGVLIKYIIYLLLLLARVQKIQRQRIVLNPKIELLKSKKCF